MAVRRFTFCLLSTAFLLVGCKAANEVRDPDYRLVARSMSQARNSPDPVADAISPINSQLAGPHSVEEYIRFALVQNPDIQAARKRLEAFAHQVPVAAGLQDPLLGVTRPC